MTGERIVSWTRLLTGEPMSMIFREGPKEVLYALDPPVSESPDPRKSAQEFAIAKILAGCAVHIRSWPLPEQEPLADVVVNGRPRPPGDLRRWKAGQAVLGLLSEPDADARLRETVKAWERNAARAREVYDREDHPWED